MSFLSYLINGVSLGSIYAIIALGYTMVYGIAKMLNFAHGDVIMIGCICNAERAQYDEPSADPGGACGGCGVYRARCCDRTGCIPPASKCGVSAGSTDHCNRVSYLLQNVALLIFGANTVSFPNKITAFRR